MGQRRRVNISLWGGVHFTPRATFGTLVLLLLGWGIVNGVNYLKHQSNLFRLREVRVEGLTYLPRGRILELAEVEKGVPLFSISPQQVARRILQNKYVRAVSVRRLIPATLLIAVWERQPVAYLIDRYEYIVDETGIILLKPAAVSVGELPLITGLKVAKLLKNREPLYRALELIEKIQEVDPTILGLLSGIHMETDGTPKLILIKGGAQVELGKEQHYRRLYLISRFLKRKKIWQNLPRIRRIDVTFDNRIIVEYKTQKG